MDAPKKPVYDKFIAGTEADAAVRRWQKLLQSTGEVPQQTIKAL
jgi:hypothetical protein